MFYVMMTIMSSIDLIFVTWTISETVILMLISAMMSLSTLVCWAVDVTLWFRREPTFKRLLLPLSTYLLEFDLCLHKTLESRIWMLLLIGFHLIELWLLRSVDCIVYVLFCFIASITNSVGYIVPHGIMARTQYP